MREIIRPVAGALSAACLALSAAAVSSSVAFGQAKQQIPPAQSAPAPAAPVAPSQGATAQPPQLKQIALTDKQVEGALAATKEMDQFTAKLPQDTKPDSKITAQLDDIAKKNGFADYADYNNVVDNISLVLGGFDPKTKKYVGVEAVIKAQIAQVEADKKMPAKDKKEALAELKEALKAPAPSIENKGNIDLVTKYYDKLAEVLGAGDDDE